MENIVETAFIQADFCLDSGPVFHEPYVCVSYEWEISDISL